MLDEKEIEIEISRLEYMESSYPNYAKLADLYTIRNQMNHKHEEILDSNYMRGSSLEDSKDVIGNYGDSEFLMSISGCNATAIWSIMNDLMDTLKVVNQRAYNNIMRKINRID